MVETTSMQPVELVAMIGPLAAFIIKRRTIAGPHPAQALCPEANFSGI